MPLKYHSHLKTPKSLTVVAVDGKQEVVRTFDVSSNEYIRGAELIKKKDFPKLAGLINPKAPKGVKVQSDIVWFNSEKLPEALARKAKEFMATKTSIAPLKAFWERCKKNPTDWSREQLYAFIDTNKIPLLPDGRMLMYKMVNADMTSHYDNTTKHEIGVPTKVDRNKCAPTPNSPCGYGLHCAPYDYVRNYWSTGVLLEVIVDPENVTSVPEGDRKMRCCEYLPNAKAGRDGFGVKEGLVTTTKKVKRSVPKKVPSRSKFSVVPFLESITITGELTVKAGFSPGQSVKVYIGKNRAVVVPSTINAEVVESRYKVSGDPVEATLKSPSASLRIRALTLGKHLGVTKKGSFKVSILEQNALVIQKNDTKR